MTLVIAKGHQPTKGNIEIEISRRFKVFLSLLLVFDL